MTKYVSTDYTGCDYITPGKRYEVVQEWATIVGFEIICDNGMLIMVGGFGCTHTKGGNWTVHDAASDTPKTVSQPQAPSATKQATSSPWSGSMTEVDTSAEAVERYCSPPIGMKRTDDGMYVRYEDYSKLLAERDTLRRERDEARNAALEEAIRKIKNSIPEPANGPFSHTNSVRVSMYDCVSLIEALKSAPATRPSVQEAAKVLLDACPNPIFDTLKPVLMCEFHQTYPFIDENGEEATAQVNVSWNVTKDIIRAALRALVQKEGE